MKSTICIIVSCILIFSCTKNDCFSEIQKNELENLEIELFKLNILTNSSEKAFSKLNETKGYFFNSYPELEKQNIDSCYYKKSTKFNKLYKYYLNNRYNIKIEITDKQEIFVNQKLTPLDSLEKNILNRDTVSNVFLKVGNYTKTGIVQDVEDIIHSNNITIIHIINPFIQNNNF